MTQASDRDKRDWWLLGGVAIAAVLLSLIGFSIASRYQPSGEAALAPVAESTTSTSTEPSTTAVSPLPVPSEQTTTTATTAEPETAAIALSETVLDFGEGENSIQVQIEHVEGGPADWELASENAGVSADPSSGRIEAGATVNVTVTIDRSELGEGEFEGTMTLNWADGQETVGLLAVSEDNPIIHNPQASPSTVQVGSGSECSPTRTTISARVRDTSEVDQVIARWSPDGSATRETAMNPVGNDIYEGVIGPYGATGNYSVKIVAFDVRGNAGGASVAVAVVDCG